MAGRSGCANDFVGLFTPASGTMGHWRGSDKQRSSDSKSSGRASETAVSSNSGEESHSYHRGHGVTQPEKNSAHEQVSTSIESLDTMILEPAQDEIGQMPQNREVVGH